MRSVIVLLRDTTKAEVAGCLQEACPGQAGPPWDWLVGSEPYLYIDFSDCIEDVGGSTAAQAALGQTPSVIVIADISGRHPGDAEVRMFLRLLLHRFRGIAKDDFTEHGWTLDEIETGQLVEGHGFFDYKGWYESTG